jgi:hypothetical protein
MHSHDEEAATAPRPDLPRFGLWLREGLRSSLLLRPRVAAGPSPRPAQLLGLLGMLWIAEIGLSRLEIEGSAAFDLRGWLAPWWSTGAALLMAWWVLSHRRAPGEPSPVAAWFALWTVAVLPPTVLSLGLGIAQSRGWMPDWLEASSVLAWVLYLSLAFWTLASAVRLAAHFGAAPRAVAAFAAALFGVYALVAWYFPDRPWQPQLDGHDAGPPQLALSQDTFESQLDAWNKAVGSIASDRPGIADVYGVVFSPYADEDVFLRESTMVARLLAERFDARDRVLHLVNHAGTAATHPWATPQNLQRAIEAIGERMDREHDVLVVYLTSHGASNFRLAAANGALQVDPVSPRELREALDLAGIKHRVIGISACYSGGWLGPLADDATLVMTAADAERTSYGCGRLSELTFFGRAVFDEQLRKTHSFERAFAAAVPVIRQREQEAGKEDGFSNPQIHVGARIREVLRGVEERLAATVPARP